MRIENTAVADEYYNALLNKDPEYLGRFVVGVKTTGIFCISTCRARKPKRENTEFFSEMADALRHGYRPCKICTPTQRLHQAPNDVREALDLLREFPSEKVGDALLRQRGLQPERIRRWFKSNYGITFQTYQRMIRVNSAYQDIKAGRSVIETAMDSGYESLSGFAYTVKKTSGFSPEQMKDKKRILLERIVTPLGPMFLGATDRGICLCEFTDRKMLETEFKDLQKRLDAVVLYGENDHTRQLKQELDEYFQGARTDFSVLLDAPGTEFQQSVWEVLGTIPFGNTASYQEQAQWLKKPQAVRAVANANGANRIAIVIPCHRVIGKNGRLTGYGGGLDRKKWLLEHEGAIQQTSV